MDRAKELKNCSAVKAILMLFIVFYHSMLLYAGFEWGPCKAANSSPAIAMTADWSCTFNVYGFPLVSGYIFYYMRCEKGAYARFLPFVANKAKRLLVPYAFIALAWAMPIHAYLYGPQELMIKYVLGTSPNQLWFLLMLFWVFVIFWPLSRLADCRPLLAAVIACALYYAYQIAPAWYSFNKGVEYVLFFYVGFMIRKWDLGNRILYKIPSLVYIAADILLFLLVGYVKEHFRYLVFYVLDVGLRAFGAVAVFVVLQRIVSRIPEDSKMLSFLSRHSMGVFLVHEQMIYLLISIFASWGLLAGQVAPPLMVLLIFNCAFAMSLIFALLMSKTRFTRFLIGEK